MEKGRLSKGIKECNRSLKKIDEVRKVYVVEEGRGGVGRIL